MDGLLELEKAKSKSSIGTTKKGIGPAYAAKVCLEGVCVRLCDCSVLGSSATALGYGYVICWRPRGSLGRSKPLSPVLRSF